MEYAGVMQDDTRTQRRGELISQHANPCRGIDGVRPQRRREQIQFHGVEWLVTHRASFLLADAVFFRFERTRIVACSQRRRRLRCQW